MRLIKIQFLIPVFLLIIGYTDARQKPINQESCEKIDSLDFNHHTPLYTSDCKGFKISELSNVLNHLFATGKPIILFVHGRGYEPNKSLKGGSYVEGNAVHKLEAQYRARVLMFNWNAEAYLLDRWTPLQKTKDAARALSTVLDGIKKYRASKNQDRPIVLLAHSMGTIVIEKLVSEYGWPSGTTKLFSNVLFTGGDANAREHDKWVSKISVAENTYITVNHDDETLAWSIDQRPDGVLPLGREPGKSLAQNATYIDISRLSSKKGKPTEQHEMFNKAGMHSQVYVCRFFDVVLKGGQPTFSAGNVETTIGKQRHALKFSRAKDDPCFK